MLKRNATKLFQFLEMQHKHGAGEALHADCSGHDIDLSYLIHPFVVKTSDCLGSSKEIQ